MLHDELTYNLLENRHYCREEKLTGMTPIGFFDRKRDTDAPTVSVAIGSKNETYIAYLLTKNHIINAIPKPTSNATSDVDKHALNI